MNARLRRRGFLQRTTLTGTGLLILDSARSAFGYPANERLNVALIGVGGRGTWFVDTIPKMENVVALCDVNATKLAAAFTRWEEGVKEFTDSPRDWERDAARHYKRHLEAQPKTFKDFRRMLDKMDKEIDAVVIATPDHTHAVASAASIRAGKHVFCEKPLTRTLHESRTLKKLAQQHKVATSMGNQGTASGGLRRALELIRQGTIGAIEGVHVWNTGGGANEAKPPQGTPPVPAELDWDLWLGPAADRPYHHDWLRRNAWRDFGTCQLGNWASHTANLAFMALEVSELWRTDRVWKEPPIIQVSARTSEINRLSFPRWESVQWKIPARGNLKPITVNWHNGSEPGIHDRLKELISDGANTPDVEHAGVVIIGSKGRIHSNGHNTVFRLLPEEKFADLDRRQPVTLERSRGHEQDWLIACRGGKSPWANFDYASALNEFLMLGNVATQCEGELDFDPSSMKVLNNPAANALLTGDYRDGWTL